MSFDIPELLSLREIQLAELEILKQLTAFLDEHHLRYSLCAGTLIGAVRHRGFIPWDDDIDICMPRPDYEELKNIAIYMPENLYMVAELDSCNNLCFAKVCDKRFVALEETSSGLRLSHNLWLDIFPLDGIPDSMKMQKRHNRNTLAYVRKKNRLYFKGDLSQSDWKKLLVKAWAYPFNKIRLKRISKLYNSLFLKYPYEEAEYVSILTCDTQKRVILPKAETSKFLKIPFEGFMFDVISNYEDFLEQRYGNYMQLPPECERKTHGLKVWRNPEV